MTGFLGNSTFGTQMLQPDDEAGNANNFVWDRIGAVPISDDILWPRSRTGGGGGLGLFTVNLDNSRPIWDWRAWVTPGGFSGMGQRYHGITGVTKDPYGNVVTSATVDMFRTVDDVKIGTTVSNSVTGAFSVTGLQDTQTVYLVAYKVGSPDITGATINTLVTGY